MERFKTINVKRPTIEGFNALKTCMAELTGCVCYLRYDMYLGNTFVENFWHLRNEIKKLAASGAVAKSMFVDYKGNKIPPIYNRLEI